MTKKQSCDNSTNKAVANQCCSNRWLWVLILQNKFFIYYPTTTLWVSPPIKALINMSWKQFPETLIWKFPEERIFIRNKIPTKISKHESYCFWSFCAKSFVLIHHHATIIFLNQSATSNDEFWRVQKQSKTPQFSV